MAAHGRQEAHDLHDRLATAVGALLDGATPERDPELFEALIPLYHLHPQRIFEEVLGPWLRGRGERLALVYAEHRALPGDLPLLDSAEALLVLERLDHDHTGLLAEWPYPLSELRTVQDAGGARLFA